MSNFKDAIENDMPAFFGAGPLLFGQLLTRL
jgi:hypothetical protein